MERANGFDVEPRRVGPDAPPNLGRWSGGRLGTPAVAWLVLLVAVAGAAALGRLVEPGSPAAAIEGQPSLAGPVQPSASAAPAARPVDHIVLSSPAVANAVITSPELAIRGYLAAGGGTIRVTLEARGNRIIDEATIQPALAFGERPTVGRHAQFETRFGLPNPRPNGRMIVQVVLLDERGQVLDVIRRPIRVGPLLEGPGA